MSRSRVGSVAGMAGVALALGVLAGGCATTPSLGTLATTVAATPSDHSAISTPVSVNPAPTPTPNPAASGTATATETPGATPTETPGATPTGPIDSPPNVVQVVDATVHADPILPSLYSVAFGDARMGWASGNGIILGTSDGGKSWHREWTGDLSVTSLTAVDGLHAWALGSPDPLDLRPTADRLLRTADGGRTWKAITVPRGFSSVTFSTDHTGWAVVGGLGTDVSEPPGRLEESIDGGLHWHTSTLKAQVGSVCFAGRSVGWAGGGSAVYRTGDGGRHWSRVDRGPNDSVNAGWQATVECRGSTAWVLWTGGAAAGSEAYRVARTLDGGAHWKIVLAQLDDALDVPRIDSYSGSFAPASSTAAGFVGWCSACGYVTWSYTGTNDGGRTFTHMPLDGLAGASIGDLVFTDARHGWMVGSAAGGFLLATADGGGTWRRAYPSTELRPVLDIAFVSPTVGFGLGVVGDARVVLRTDDAGATWRSAGRLPVHPVAPDRDPILSFVDAAHGWAAVVGGVLATADGGRSWQRVPGAPPGGVVFSTAVDGCAGTFNGSSAANGSAAATSDGGATWQPIDASRGLVACAASLVDPAWTTAARSFDPGDLLPIEAIVGPDHGWAVGALDLDRLGVVGTTDGGATWTAHRWPVPADGVGGMVTDTLVRVSFVSPDRGWLLTLFGHLWATTDGGASWREVGDG